MTPITTDIADLLDELRWNKRVTEDDTTNLYGRTIAALETAHRRIEELERQLGGGCDANGGDHHKVIKQGKYAFCGDCGESLRGVRYCHLPRATLQPKEQQPSSDRENSPPHYGIMVSTGEIAPSDAAKSRAKARGEQP